MKTIGLKDCIDAWIVCDLLKCLEKMKYGTILIIKHHEFIEDVIGTAASSGLFRSGTYPETGRDAAAVVSKCLRHGTSNK